MGPTPKMVKCPHADCAKEFQVSTAGERRRTPDRHGDTKIWIGMGCPQCGRPIQFNDDRTDASTRIPDPFE